MQTDQTLFITIAVVVSFFAALLLAAIGAAVIIGLLRLKKVLDASERLEFLVGDFTDEVKGLRTDIKVFTNNSDIMGSLKSIQEISIVGKGLIEGMASITDTVRAFHEFAVKQPGGTAAPQDLGGGDIDSGLYAYSEEDAATREEQEMLKRRHGIETREEKIATPSPEKMRGPGVGPAEVTELERPEPSLLPGSDAHIPQTPVSPVSPATTEESNPAKPPEPTEEPTDPPPPDTPF